MEKNLTNNVTLNSQGGEEDVNDSLPRAIEEQDNTLGLSDEEDKSPVDYFALEEEDLKVLKREFPELSGIKSITELKNPLRYGALRDLGLTPRESYLATGGSEYTHQSRGNRDHLVTSVPRGSYSDYIGMTKAELENARQIFHGLSDSEINALYKKVTR